MKKIATLLRYTGRSFANSTQKQQQLLRPLNDLENGPFNNRETYNIRKQQTRFVEHVHENMDWFN